MVSRWKHVDLLSLSSVAPAVARRRGQRPASTPLSSRLQRRSPHVARISREEANPQLTIGERGPDAIKETAMCVPSSRDALATQRGAYHARVGSTVFPTSCVPPVAVEASTAVRVSVSNLFCRSSLSWNSALECFFALTEGECLRRASTAETHETQQRQEEDKTMPLEAIVAVYGALLRREAQHTGVSNCRHEDVISSSTIEADRSQSLQHDTSLASQGSVSSLSFLAYAARQHPSLHPIAVLLGSDKGGDVGSAPERHFNRSGAYGDAHRSRPPLPVLTLCTVIHLGLLEPLHMSPVPPSSSSSAPNSASRIDSTTASASRVRQQWVAVQAIHRLHRSGWAADYFRSLDSTPAEVTGSMVGTPALGGSLGETEGQEPAALELVRCAALGVPYFTCLFSVLEGAWELYHARFSALSSGRQWPLTEEVGYLHEFPLILSQQRPASTLAGSEQTKKVNSARCETSIDSVRAIAEVSTQERPHAVEAISDAVHEEILSMSRGQLLAVTLDVILFAWRAMEIRQRRRSGAAGVPDDHSGEASRSAAAGTAAEKLKANISSMGSGIHQTFTSAAALVAEEQGELLRLVRIATRWSTFEELCTWIDHLLARGEGLIYSEIPGAPSLSPALSPQQEEALLCLLTRAVRRAPSWMAACTVLNSTWCRLPCTGVVACDARSEVHGEVWCPRDSGVASVPALLEAFLSSSYAPEVALPSQVSRQTVHSSTPGDASFWCRVMVCGVTSDSEGEHWARIMFGSESPVFSAGLRVSRCTALMERRHVSLTKAALMLVQRWLRPAEALGVALQCLARSHARCAHEWTTFLARHQRGGREDDRAAERCSPKTDPVGGRASRNRAALSSGDAIAPSVRAPMAAAPVEESTSPATALATRLMAEQHRAYCGALLSTQEQREWLDLTLRYVTSGPARQLIIKAALLARWHCGSDASSTLYSSSAVRFDGGGPPPEVNESLIEKSHLAAAVTDLSMIASAWVAPESEMTTGSEAAAMWFDREGSLPPRLTLLGETGRLLTDVKCVLYSVPGGPSAVEELFTSVGAAVTVSGLHLERRAAPSHASFLPNFKALVAVPTSCGVLSLDECAAVAVTSPSPSGFSSERYTGREFECRLVQLRSWLELLCTCPASFVSKEQDVVVWLYVVMRQMEEMHECAKESSAQLNLSQPQPREAPHVANNVVCNAQVEASSNDHGKEEQRFCWSLEAEEAAVRRVAQSLSSQLWSVLPASSLLPPMLLNWLLTRGGETTWSGAVRTLRAAAGDESDVREDRGGRRFSLLALPLDRVVSVEHAVRVLCTLQAVEERCTASATSAKAPPMQPTSPPPPSPPSPPPQDCDGGCSIPTASPKAPCATKRGSPAVTTRGSGQPSGTPLVAEVYGRIERVLLREWYGRALAAVLHFFAEHPQHTYLTHVKDAPHYAALTQCRRQVCEHRSPDLLEINDSVAQVPKAEATRGWSNSVSRPTHTPPPPELSSWPERLEYNKSSTDSVLSDTTAHTVSSLEHWRAWLDGAVAAGDAEKAAIYPQRVTATLADATSHVNRMRSMTDLPSVLADSTIDIPVSHEKVQCLLRDGISPCAVKTPSASILRVPLYLLATFVLQECYIGIAHSTSSRGSTSSAATNNGRVAISRRGGQVLPSLSALGTFLCSPLSPASFLDVLMRDVRSWVPRHDSQNHLTGGSEASATAPFSTHEVPTIRPELLLWFTRVLHIKQQEMEACQGSAATSETLEAVVAVVLSERCPKGGEFAVQVRSKGAEDLKSE